MFFLSPEKVKVGGIKELNTRETGSVLYQHPHPPCQPQAVATWSPMLGEELAPPLVWD